MARAGAPYPQVEPRAGALADRRVAIGPPGTSVRQALLACRRARARALSLGARRIVREDDLVRAVAFGLGALAAELFAWRDLPVVEETALELEVRRHVVSGAPIVLVREGRRIVGFIERGRAGDDGSAVSLTGRLDHPASRDHDARLWLLRVAGKIGEGMGAPAFAVGGFVRDLLLGRTAPDLDLVVEGDGIAFAERLHQETGGTLTVHATFGTASIVSGTAPGDATLPRVDVASARRERYERPGALPAVSPAGLTDDLMRRDFTINAMALDLAPSSFGRLLDPCGGRHDLRRRVLRPLHPSSFIEDPTRLFRGARYAARLGLRLGADGRAARDLALRIGDYPALSGQRLRAELGLLAAEVEPVAAFDQVLRWRLLTLWDRRFRPDARVRGRLRAMRRIQACARSAGLSVDAGDAALVALLIGQRPNVVDACLDRLAIRGEPRRALAAAVRGAGARLARARRPSEIADALERLPMTVLAGAWLAATGPVRRRIEWFLEEGRATRPLLSGKDLIALGVPRGPAVGLYLSRLRHQRLDSRATTVRDERASVKRWLGNPDPPTRPARPEHVKEA
jgi:tRNA nucleotidyltransferase (CCA-adding enzyme)